MSEPVSDCFAARSFASHDVIDDTSANTCGGASVGRAACIDAHDGLGGARPLSRFLDMAGLDMVKQTASTQGWCSKGQPPPPEFL